MTVASEVGELLTLARLGKDELEAKRKAGTLRPGHVWLAAKGAAKYAAAVAGGDLISEDGRRTRLALCLGCVSRTESLAVDGGGEVKHWCGPALEEHRESVLPTCGCLLGVTIEGVAHAGGKLAVASERCWQGRWGAGDRATTMGQAVGVGEPNARTTKGQRPQHGQSKGTGRAAKGVTKT